jgi:hypothetical protein
MNYRSKVGTWSGLIAVVALLVGGTASPLAAQGPPSVVKGQRLKELLSPTGYAALMHVRAARAAGRRALLPPGGEDEEEGSVIPKDNFVTAEPEPDDAPFGSGGREGRGFGRNKRFQNVFVNDPCLDPPPYAPYPENFLRTVQSETEIAVLNKVPRDKGKGESREDEDNHAGDRGGRLMVAGYNDSWGFYNNRQGLSGYAYSTDGGKSWIDGGGLPPIVKSGAEAGTPGSDAYFGDPVVQVHHRSKTFYYASIYLTSAGIFTIAVNRGHFQVAPPQNSVEPESKSNTRCAKNPAKWGVPDPPGFIRERIIWEPPVVAVPIEGTEDDFIDKEWLYVDQRTGELYLAYLRGAADGSTPLELMRSKDGGHTWIGPTVIVPNLFDTFNTGVSVVTTVSGRVIVSWFARTFPAPEFEEREQRIEAAYSDNDGVTFSRPVLVSQVNPQGEPPGYNRERPQILNVTWLAVDKGKYDGALMENGHNKRSGYGNVYVSYFSGKTPFASPPAENPEFARAANIYVSRSTNNGTSWRPRVKVNDDRTETSHVFPSVQVNKDGVVFTTWIDRRVDPARNLLSDTWGDVSRTQGRSYNGDVRITDVSTDWFARADAAPNFGDYNSSEVINFKDFVSIWADGRFPKPAPLTPTGDGGYTRPGDQAATPDTFFEIFGDGSGHGHGGDND